MLIGMNSALNQAPPILQGFCELLGEHLGAIISVLITLSIPSNDGNIEIRRYISEFNFCSTVILEVSRAKRDHILCELDRRHLSFSLRRPQNRR